MIVEGLGCAKWLDSGEAILEAREELVMLLGPHSVLGSPNPRKRKNEMEYSVMATDQRKTKLRIITMKMGLLEKIELAKSLRWDIERFYERLEGDFPECRDWTDEDISDIISDLNSGKKRQPAKSGDKVEESAEVKAKEEVQEEKTRQPAKKRRRRSKKTEAVEETSSEDTSTVEETPVKEKAPAKSKTRKPAARKKRQPVVDGEPQAAVFQVDGKALIEEFGLADVKDQVVSNQTLLAGLTVETEDIKTDVSKIAGKVNQLEKTISSIEKMLVWFYNSETDEEIESLSEVFK